MGSRFKGCGGGFAASVYETMPESDIAAIYTPRRFLTMSVVTLLLSPSLGRGTPEGQGVGRRRNRAKPTSGATRHLLPKEGGRSGMSSPSTPFPWKWDARRARGWPKGRGVAEGERERSQPPALRATSFQRKEGEAGCVAHLPPSPGRGMPEGQGVGRRRNRAKPTSGAARHLLPEEGGRSGMRSPSTPFPWKGDARRAGGWPKEKKSEANLRRYAPPPFRGRREQSK